MIALIALVYNELEWPKNFSHGLSLVSKLKVMDSNYFYFLLHFYFIFNLFPLFYF